MNDRRNCFDDHRLQSYLIFEPVFEPFKIFTATSDEVCRWNLSEEKITTSDPPVKGVAFRLNYINHAKK